MAPKKKSYRVPPEVKADIIRRVKEEGVSVAQAVKDHGISNATIYAWLGTGASGTPSWGEFSRLQKQNKELFVPILTLESGRPVNPWTGLDSNQSHAFPLSARPLGLGRNSLNTPALATMDFRALKYFPFGGAKRLDVVAEFFNLFNSANPSQINPVFGSGSMPIPGFRQPIAGTGARQVQFSLDFEF
jgi:hypothetical protein